MLEVPNTETPALWEGDYLYFLSGWTIVKYDLSADDVEASAEYTQLLPQKASIKCIYSHDSDYYYYYVCATLWDKENERSTLEKYFKIARDSSSYVEITAEDIQAELERLKAEIVQAMRTYPYKRQNNSTAFCGANFLSNGTLVIHRTKFQSSCFAISFS